MHWDFSYGWGPGIGAGCLAILLFWVLVILGVIYLIRLMAGYGKKDDHRESPLDIIKIRYARGEITREEYEKMKEDLKKE